MIRPLNLLISAVILSAGAAAVGYWTAGSWLGGLAAIAWAGFWIISIVRQAYSFSTLAMLGYAVLAVQSINVGVQPGWLLLALVAALAAWDLEFLMVRLLDIEDELIAEEITSKHSQRLGLAVAAGLLISGAALLFQYQLDFWWAMLISALAVIGLARFIALLRQPRS